MYIIEFNFELDVSIFTNRPKLKSSISPQIASRLWQVYPVISDNSVYNNLANTICKSNAYSVLKAKTKVILLLNSTIAQGFNENLTGKILSEKSKKFAVGAIVAAVVICIVQLIAPFAQNLITK